MSNELYLQQREIKDLKKKIFNLNKRIDEVDEDFVVGILKEDKNYLITKIET